MKTKAVAGTVLTVLLVGMLTLASSGHTYWWYIEIVDSEPSHDVGKYTSIAVGSNNHIHISYYDESHGDLKYANYDGSSWDIWEQLDGWYVDVGMYTSIAVDSANRPHISYIDWDNWDLKYTYWEAPQWYTRTCPSPTSVYSETSIAVDSTNKPHFSFYSNGDLKHAYYDGIDWFIETVDSSGLVGRYSSIAVDSTDRRHISYYDVSNGDLKYAYYDGTDWHTERLDSTGDVGYFTSIAVNSTDNPHISYHDNSNGDLKYAYYDGTDWHIETVDSIGNVGSYTSIAVDSLDNIHISYQDDSQWDLEYAYSDGTDWHIETVDSTGDGFSSIAVDSACNPHISYYEEGFGIEGYLKYAFTLGEPVRTLTITATGGGTTDPPLGTHTYVDGSSDEVTAIPDVDCAFDHWELDGSWNYSNPISVTMDSDRTLLAVFAYNVTIQAHCNDEVQYVSVSITVDGLPTDHNTPHTFTGLTGTHNFTIPSTDPHGHPFKEWSTGETNTTVTVISGGTYTAYYHTEYTLNITRAWGGTTVPPPGTHTYLAGSSVQVVAFPYSGCVFDHWELDDSHYGSDPIGVIMMNSNHTLLAVFTFLGHGGGGWAVHGPLEVR